MGPFLKPQGLWRVLSEDLLCYQPYPSFTKGGDTEIEVADLRSHCKQVAELGCELSREAPGSQLLTLVPDMIS